MKLELKAIRAQREKWIEAVNNGDIDAISEIMSDDAVWMPASIPALNGKKAILDWIKPSIDNFDHQFSISHQDLKGAGNWVVEHADFSHSLTPKDGGETTEFPGSYIVIWRWEKDNVWRIERYVDNSNVLVE
ncbi:MAG TPA: nuclear transport factor 2 family protein [Cyclobacteriaceae bacterium]|jgi:uncharacterized protein (TIGR02246 family)